MTDISGDSNFQLFERLRRTFVRKRDGFTVGGVDGLQKVRVQLLESCWQLSTADLAGRSTFKRVGLPCVRDLSSRIATAVCSDHVQRSGRGGFSELKKRTLSRFVRVWAARLLADEWGRLSHRVTPRILDVQCTVFAACRRVSSIFFDPAFYGTENRYVLEDMYRYRAAAITVNDLSVSLIGREYFDVYHSEYKKDDLRFPDLAAVCEELRDWRGLLSDTGRSYRALNQTLDHLPKKMSSSLLTNMRYIHLNRPFFNRIELLLQLVDVPMPWDDNISFNLNVLQCATEPEIRKAMGLVSRALQRELTPGVMAHIRIFSQYLTDYPELHRGRIVGLAEASIRFHREIADGEVRLLSGADLPVKRPPVPLPEVDGLRFLGTTKEIEEEGRLMGHCIPLYANKALRGKSYLFHFDDAGEMASIEVESNGLVRQSFGPMNCSNNASLKGRQILTRWASTFRRPLPR